MARGVLVATVVLFVLGAGCMEPGAKKDFAPVEAPEWLPGQSWTYDVETSYRADFSRDGAKASEQETDTSAHTMTVFNTTGTIGGERVAFVRSEGDLDDHPYLEGNVWAISMRDLRIVAHAWEPMAGTPQAACSGPLVFLEPVAPDGRFPALRFPLRDGLAWKGTWSL